MPRRSPEESATQFKPGTVRTGLDGHTWKVKSFETKNGVVQRWVKSEETVPKKKSKAEIIDERFPWNAMFGNKVYHFRKHTMSNLTPQQARVWNQFMAAREELQARGISVVLVPWDFDEEAHVWWADYPAAYMEQFFPDVTGNAPYMIVAIKVDEKGQYYPVAQKDGIRIDHFGIKHGLKKDLMRILGQYPWFRWNGKQTHAMFIKMP